MDGFHHLTFAYFSCPIAYRFPASFHGVPVISSAQEAGAFASAFSL
jgi:hypothetical protein